ncbi:unnamed protein product [Rotaria magnacalcarata]|uniref:Neurotransmitter-gated ion-channel ligand-binding domain-containing protein n=1 Tax=Rotaria magnacalcarata TaxID=392030 RepID=A0A816REP1_9BILA|nr:unnamed protein product [Rotaria magnacalcarata]
MLPVKNVWIPDTMILNSADPSGYFTLSDYSYAGVYYTGDVYVILPVLTIKTKYSNDSVLLLDDYSAHPLWALTGTDVIVTQASDRIPYGDGYNVVKSTQLFLKRNHYSLSCMVYLHA